MVHPQGKAVARTYAGNKISYGFWPVPSTLAVEGIAGRERVWQPHDKKYLVHPGE